MSTVDQAPSPRVLVVDDEPFTRRYFETVLQGEGYGYVSVDTSRAFTDYLNSEGPPDLIILDVRLPDGNGLELLKIIRSQNYLTPVIMITAYGSIDDAVSAMKTGAFDFFTKPFDDVHKIKISIKNALEHRRLVDENRLLKTQLHSRRVVQNIIGTSTAMQHVLEIIRKVAVVGSHILIEGESGTGKELVAEATHALSDRSAKAFIPINCAALPESLLESALFGYEKGAFTGASRVTRGFFEEAQGGTLFLDEIGDAPMSVQTKILRAVEDGEIYRVGSTKRIATDVRLIFATNKDLGQEVLEGRFRRDLYYRINVIKVTLPPLRERKEDIPILARHFFDKTCKRMGVDKKVLTDEAESCLLRRSWPGNVRELKNLVERIVALHAEDVVTARDLSKYTQDKGESKEEDLFHTTYELAKKLFEERYFSRLLEETSGDLSQAAERSGVHVSTIYRKLNALGISFKG